MNVQKSYSQRGGLSASTIKWFAVFCMAIDHIAWAFVPTFSAVGIVMHAFGRITAPCMCFFLTEGYVHTHDIRRYLLRMGIFALLSWPCFVFFERGPGIWALEPGMIWSLFFSLLAITAVDRLKGPVPKMLAVAGCMLATLVGDWPLFCVAFTLVFWLERGQFYRQAAGFAAAAVLMALFYASDNATQAVSPRWFFLQLCVLLALFPLSRYNGTRGDERHPKCSKWGFYIFYPAHLFLLGILRYFVFV
ncbi:MULTISPECIES: TraX family protein [Caproicibacterium]|jgi:hypothetical protein|uniref:Conjugal transfer protein TraX n=1 Tax=Caproicibacterium lactatifermentans TaxID=2666138 RepID=A0A859DSP8_9FIRM|nr:TraX family protein [Caproicibacterium lactatifermentans]ARP50436.1 hypothetical protein B6259_05805 [Ruminococcaceae bacterium CPB6]MDD4807277.1 TraX family protein [Oscillospiraceae bacterium]QKN23842.1 hypothetical protein GJQ69_04730 [Caproicibacterium lactatifermentans]